MKRKVRIKSLPEGYHMMPDGNIMKDSAHMSRGGSVKKSLSPVSRNAANLEAEKGEVAMTDLAGDGIMGLYSIGGQRHVNGGTPLNLEEGSFIYSDTKNMKIKDPEFLAKYGKKKSVTPAKLVKPYLNLNDFTAALQNKDADPIQKRTASAMIDKYKGKAGEIAFYQEAMKGFPQGVPGVAEDYAEGIMGSSKMAYGGYIPKAQKGGTSEKKKAFIEKYGPIAIKVGEEFGIDPSIILGQASQESGWGTSNLFNKSNNLFGIIAAGRPNDYWGGRKTPGQIGNFRAYDNVEQSMADFARLIRDKYPAAYASGNDPAKYAAAIANSPYISEANGDDRAIYERNVRDNSLEIQRLLPTVISDVPRPTSQEQSGVDPYVMDRYLGVNPSNRANLRDVEQPQFFNPRGISIPQEFEIQTSFDPANPEGINFAYQSPWEASRVQPYPGGKTQPGLVTPTGVENRFVRDLPEYMKSWYDLIPGITGMPNKEAQSAVYDYLLENEPDVIRNMWGTYGLTAKGMKNKPLAAKYKTGQINPAELTDSDLADLKDAYVDGLYGVRQMDPPYQAPAEDSLLKQEPINLPPKEFGFPESRINQRSGFSAPGLNDKIALDELNAKTPDETTAETPGEEAKQKTESSASSKSPERKGAVPFQQDVNALATGVRNQMSERKYFPYAPKLAYSPYDPTYLDDTRQQQQIAGRARSTMEALGAFAGPARQAAMASSVAGQAGEEAANVAANIGNQNVGIANQANLYNAQMKTQADAANAQLAMDLFDKSVKTQEVFDEKQRKYRALNTALNNNMLTNAYRAKTMNQMNPLFQIQPGEGQIFNTGNIEFMPGVSSAMFDPENWTTQSDRDRAMFDGTIQEIKSSGMSPEDQSKAISSLFNNRIESLYGKSTKSKQPSPQDLQGMWQWLQNSYPTVNEGSNWQDWGVAGPNAIGR